MNQIQKDSDIQDKLRLGVDISTILLQILPTSGSLVFSPCIYNKFTFDNSINYVA